MGYYPTPPDVVDRIKSFLHYPDGNVNLLDPCCGQGQALGTVAEGANATTYGIELAQYRAEEAKSLLDHVLKCSYGDTRISHSAFPFLSLNPPYDWATPDEQERRKCTEKAFLRGTVPYVKPSRLLTYIVLQHGRLECLPQG